jgi:hypothetical protein
MPGDVADHDLAIEREVADARPQRLAREMRAVEVPRHPGIRRMDSGIGHPAGCDRRNVGARRGPKAQSIRHWGPRTGAPVFRQVRGCLLVGLRQPVQQPADGGDQRHQRQREPARAGRRRPARLTDADMIGGDADEPDRQQTDEAERSIAASGYVRRMFIVHVLPHQT